MVNLIVTNDSGDFYEYILPVPVAKTVNLPGPVSANYTCFDILTDGRILALAGTSIQMEDSAGSGTFTEKATVPAADPSFIEISPDESFALVGAGAVSGYNGYIWKVDFSDWSVTRIADIDSNYAMAWTPDGDVLVNAGRADYSGADIFFLDMSDYSVDSVITLEGYSSGGLAVDSDGNAYVAGAVTNNDVRVFNACPDRRGASGRNGYGF